MDMSIESLNVQLLKTQLLNIKSRVLLVEHVIDREDFKLATGTHRLELSTHIEDINDRINYIDKEILR